RERDGDDCGERKEYSHVTFRTRFGGTDQYPIGTPVRAARRQEGLTFGWRVALILPVAADIRVDPEDGDRFPVTVREGSGQTVHHVTVPPPYLVRLTAGRVAADELVRRSFEFLLEREPKESILESFDLPLIGRYFPEYERELKRRLGTAGA